MSTLEQRKEYRETLVTHGVEAKALLLADEVPTDADQRLLWKVAVSAQMLTHVTCNSAEVREQWTTIRESLMQTSLDELISAQLVRFCQDIQRASDSNNEDALRRLVELAAMYPLASENTKEALDDRFDLHHAWLEMDPTLFVPMASTALGWVLLLDHEENNLTHRVLQPIANAQREADFQSNNPYNDGAQGYTATAAIHTDEEDTFMSSKPINLQYWADLFKESANDAIVAAGESIDEYANSKAYAASGLDSDYPWESQKILVATDEESTWTFHVRLNREKITLSWWGPESAAPTDVGVGLVFGDNPFDVEHEAESDRQGYIEKVWEGYAQERSLLWADTPDGSICDSTALDRNLMHFRADDQNESD